jgi:hypothetical protein
MPRFPRALECKSNQTCTWNIQHPSIRCDFIRKSLSSFLPIPPLHYLPLIPNPTQCLGTVQAPANGVVLYNIPCARPAGSDPAFLSWEFEPTIPGVVRLQGTNFCVDAGLGFNEREFTSRVSFLC